MKQPFIKGDHNMNVYFTDALAVLGAAYVVASTLASILPKGSVQSFFATIALDLSQFKGDGYSA
jgi:hypothetical protein